VGGVATKMTPGGVVASAMSSGGPGLRRKDRAAVVGLLEDVPLFAGLSRRHLRRISSLAEQVRFRDGRVIVEAGLPGTAFYAIANGRAKVYRSKIPTGRAMARLGPGDFFGEMSLIDGGPRSATVVADGEVLAVRLSRAAFKKVVTKEPSVALAIMSELAGRIRRGSATE
jgi:CRP/FNR family transcriptional regulator, cyclic AMP receptor protein